MSGRFYKAMLRRREERGLLPGGVKHLALRKRYFDDQVVKGLEEGATQVVILGAGLDTVAPRHAGRWPHVRFLEVDFPATQKVKQDGLNHANLAPPNLHLVPLDLSDATLRETLLAHAAFKEGEPTVFVAEGLLMYLAPEEVRSIFDLVSSIGGPGSRIVFSFIEVDPGGTFQMGGAGWFLRPMLAMIGEPFRWGVPRAELEDVVADRGLSLTEQFCDQDLLGEYLPEHLSAVCLGWEYVAVARKPSVED